MTKTFCGITQRTLNMQLWWYLIAVTNHSAASRHVTAVRWLTLSNVQGRTHTHTQSGGVTCVNLLNIHSWTCFHNTSILRESLQDITVNTSHSSSALSPSFSVSTCLSVCLSVWLSVCMCARHSLIVLLVTVAFQPIWTIFAQQCMKKILHTHCECTTSP